MQRVVRGVALGAALGALLGLIAGLIVHAVVSNDDSVVVYEIVAGLIGLIFGAGLGGFYGGALNLPPDEPE